MASTPVLLQLHSLLSIQLNNKRSGTSLTWGKGSHYLNAFHNIIHMMFFLKRTWSKLCIINSLEKMFCWKKIPVVFKGFLKVLFSGLFQVWIFILDYFPGFQAFSSLCGNPGRKPLQYLEGRGSLCFHGLIFLLSIVLSTKSEKLTNPSDVLALKVFRFDVNKTNMISYLNQVFLDDEYFVKFLKLHKIFII